MPEEVNASNKEFTDTRDSEVYQNMSIWEKIVLKFFTFFRKDMVKDFYENCGINQLEQKITQDSLAWYSFETKELTSKFAQDMHTFIKALATIVSILKITTGAIVSKEKKAYSTKILLIEHIFCNLRGISIKKDYPFTEKSIFKMVNDLPIREVETIVSENLHNYFSTFHHKDIEEINNLYTRLVYLDKALSVANMDFLRRFNLHVNLTDTFTWIPLSLSAAGYYLENLLHSIMTLEIKESDFLILLSLQKTGLRFNPEAPEISSDKLKNAWNTISIYLFSCLEKERLINLLKLSHKCLDFSINVSKSKYQIFDRFRTTVEERLKSVTTGIARHSLEQEMKLLVKDILPSSVDAPDLTDVGIFNATNSDKIQASIDENLHHVYAMTLLQVFIIKFYKPWLKGFLGACAVNAQFNQSSVKTELSKIYKSLNKLTKDFDKFASDVHPKSSMGVRIGRLLENQKMNRSDKHLLKVFTGSLNSQADVLIKEFYVVFPELFVFISKLLFDLENNTKDFIANVISVKTLQNNENLSLKLKELKEFSISILDLLNIKLPIQS